MEGLSSNDVDGAFDWAAQKTSVRESLADRNIRDIVDMLSMQYGTRKR
jgi:hypothetical protein